MLDNSWLIYLNSILFENKFIDSLVYFVAEPFPLILLAFALIYYGLIRKLLKPLVILLTVIGAWAFSEILKFLFSVPRPFISVSEVEPLFVFGGYDSFPSGHAAVFSALATLIFIKDKKLGVYFIFAAIIIGVSRIVAGIHRPQDILAGFVLGFLSAILVHKTTRKLGNNNEKSED